MGFKIIIYLFFALLSLNAYSLVIEKDNGKTYEVDRIIKYSKVGVRFWTDDGKKKFVGHNSLSKKAKKELKELWEYQKYQKHKSKIEKEKRIAKAKQLKIDRMNLDLKRMEREEELAVKEAEEKKRRKALQLRQLKKKEKEYLKFAIMALIQDGYEIFFLAKTTKTIDRSTGYTYRNIIGQLTNISGKPLKGIKITMSFYKKGSLFDTASIYPELTTISPNASSPFKLNEYSSIREADKILFSFSDYSRTIKAISCSDAKKLIQKMIEMEGAKPDAGLLEDNGF